MLSIAEMHIVIKLLKKAHVNQIKSIIGYTEQIILKNKELKKE